MKFLRFIFVFSLLVACVSVYAQVEVDYNRPKQYYIGGVTVEGNTYFDSSQITAQSGLFRGRKLTIPGDDIATAIKRLLSKNYFEDVAIYADSLNA
ncbi:MAG TPA: hypothetical protein DHU75_01445, partial [Rikenellaceae bacterium]|nr:hypothetical protein [Rikenellaceae bacterium]